MPDMLVRLYDMPDQSKKRPLEEGIVIKRALNLDRSKIVDFVKANFSEGWVNECKRAMNNDPVSCYIAVKDGAVIGFACYDSTAKGMFGPTGILESARGKGVGDALLNACMVSMREKGYAYAIIGWVTDTVEFYKKSVGAEIIEGATTRKSIYQNLISGGSDDGQ